MGYYHDYHTITLAPSYWQSWLSSFCMQAPIVDGAAQDVDDRTGGAVFSWFLRIEVVYGMIEMSRFKIHPHHQISSDSGGEGQMTLDFQVPTSGPT